MKKIIYLLALLATVGIGAVYRVDLLFALGIAEILVWVCLAVITRLHRKHLKLGFEKQLATTIRQKKAPCSLRAQNTSRFAIAQFRARLWYGYYWEKKPKKMYLYGSLEGREVQHSRVELPALSCGFLQLKLDRIRVHDWFGLTSARCKDSPRCLLAVLPPTQAMTVELSYRSAGDSAALLLRSLPQQNGDSEEIRQLREYQDGDQTRSIHWKQSARTDKLWVKEYEQQSDRLVELHLVWTQFRFARPQQREGFYTILSSLLYGLLRALPQVPVYWTEEERGPRSMLLNSEEGITDLLLQLYHLEQGRSLAVDHPAPPIAQKGRIMRLEFTSGLQLREDRKVLCDFSSQQYSQQLSRFTLRL